MSQRAIMRRAAVIVALIGVAGVLVLVVALITSSTRLLAWAVREDHPLIVQALLWYGVNINSKDAKGGTPLFAAAESGRIELAQFLLRHGAEINATNR